MQRMAFLRSSFGSKGRERVVEILSACLANKEHPASDSQVLFCGLIGTVFVKENASVLMEVIVGLTAAESAQYRPPIPHDCLYPQQCH